MLAAGWPKSYARQRAEPLASGKPEERVHKQEEASTSCYTVFLDRLETGKNFCADPNFTQNSNFRWPAMLVRLAIVIWVLPIGALAVSAAILGVHRNFRGDVFVLRQRHFLESSDDIGRNGSHWTSGDGKGQGCSASDCRSGGRKAALIPWRPCQCQCDPSSPTFRQDRGDCVDTIDECRLIPFASSVSTENVPLVFLPPSGHLIYPSAEIALAASMSAFPQMSCHVRRARHLTASGWVSASNVTHQKLAFQLVHETRKFFLQYVGTETSRRLLDGHILLVEFACKAANGANIVPDPCSSFRVAGTLAAESFSATPWTSGGPRVTAGASGSSKRPKDMYVVIGLCAGLLGVMYVLAVLIYLLVRRQQRDKRNGVLEGAARGKANVSQSHPDQRQNQETGHSGQQNSRGNNKASSSSNEFLSKLRSVIEAARCKLGPTAYLPSLKDIPEETASICDSLDGLDDRVPSSTSRNVTKEDRQDVDACERSSERTRATGDRWHDQDAISGNWSALCANPGFMLNRETNVRRSLSANNDEPKQEEQQQLQLTKKRCRSVSGPVVKMETFPKKGNIPPPPPLPSFGSSKMPIDSLLKVRKLKPPQREEVESPYYSLADTSEEPSGDNRGTEEEEQRPPPLPPKKIRPQGVPLPSMVPASSPIKRIEKVVEEGCGGDDPRKMTVSRGRPVIRNQNQRQQEKLTVIKRSESSVSDNDTTVDSPDDQSSSLRSARSALDVRRSGSSASDTANGRKRQLGFDSGGRPVHGLHSGSLSSVLPRRQQSPRDLSERNKNALESAAAATERRVLVKALVESYNKRQIGGKCPKKGSGRWTVEGKKDEKGIYAASSVSDFGDDSTLERDAASSEGSKGLDVGRRRRIGPHEDSGYHSSDSELSSAIRFIQRTATQGQHGGLMAASRVRFSIPEVMMAIDDDDGNEVDLKGDVASNVSDGSFPDSLNGSPPLSSRNSAKRFPEAYEFVFTEKL